MLILIRKRGEKIIFKDNIVVEVLEVAGSKVKLAIHAPNDVLIDRTEVRIKRSLG
jgi:carbon storage regulator CsrA